MSTHAVSSIPPTTPVRGRWRPRMVRRHGPVMIAASGFVLFVFFLAIFGSMIAPQNPAAINLMGTLQQPSGAHWLGTDVLGRDVFSRILAGARSAVMGPLVIAIGSMILGDILGLISGYFGGRVDTIVMRWVDLMWSIPALFVAIVVTGITSGGYWTAVFVLLFLSIPYDTRLVRGAVLTQRELPYVEAAQVNGVGAVRIMLVHIWPNVLPVAISNAFLNFPYALISLVGLSFLGLGVPPGAADWGKMLDDGRAIIYSNEWLMIGSAIMIVLTAVAMNLVGDGLQERFDDAGTVRV